MTLNAASRPGPGDRVVGNWSALVGPGPPHSPSSSRVPPPPPPPPPAFPVTRGNCCGAAPDVPRTHSGGAEQRDGAGFCSSLPKVRKRAKAPAHCARGLGSGGRPRRAGERLSGSCKTAHVAGGSLWPVIGQNRGGVGQGGGSRTSSNAPELSWSVTPGGSR